MALVDNLLVSQAAQGVALSVPWGPEAVTPGTGFESKGIFSRPWVKNTPFKPFDSTKAYMVYEPDNNSRASFRSAESESHSSSSEHYSGSLGATVDVKFASANVTASYDKNIQENKDSNKVSRNVTMRAGAITFIKAPELDFRVMQLLELEDGEARFRAQYGDYYVAGMVLGGESGSFLSVDMGRKTTTDTVSISVTVKALFFKPKTSSKSKSTKKLETSLAFACYGFDTLRNTNTNNGPSQRLSLEQAQKFAVEYIDLADTLEYRLSSELQDLGVNKTHSLTLKECEDISRSGVVMQLILAPYKHLMSYKYALLRRDGRTISTRFAVPK